MDYLTNLNPTPIIHPRPLGGGGNYIIGDNVGIAIYPLDWCILGKTEFQTLSLHEAENSSHIFA